MIQLPPVLPQPERPAHLPEKAKWLAGEGAGSWFVIESVGSGKLYWITRFSPEGVRECTNLFTINPTLQLDMPYDISYPSHCRIVTVLQQGKTIRLTPVKDPSMR